MIDNLPKLQWACRRGMLELDVLLGNFLNKGYPHLSLAKKEQFIALLSYSDPEIFAWLMGHEIPTHPDIANITKEIRSYARS